VNGLDLFNAHSDGYVAHRVMVWEEIAPNASGELRLFITPKDDNCFGYLAAMRIEEIPEPAGALLLSVGGLLLGCLLRRRRAVC